MMEPARYFANISQRGPVKYRDGWSSRKEVGSERRRHDLRLCSGVRRALVSSARSYTQRGAECAFSRWGDCDRR